MIDHNKYNQLDKLAKTLLSSGLVSSSAEAMKKAKEILKLKPEKEKIDIATLPKIEDIKAADSGKVDKSLKELMEKDAGKVYNNKPHSSEKK